MSSNPVVSDSKMMRGMFVHELEQVTDNNPEQTLAFWAGEGTPIVVFLPLDDKHGLYVHVKAEMVTMLEPSPPSRMERLRWWVDDHMPRRRVEGA